MKSVLRQSNKTSYVKNAFAATHKKAKREKLYVIQNRRKKHEKTLGG